MAKSVSTSVILHISNDYSGSEVYKNLCKALDQVNICQIIYTAVRKPDLIDKNSFVFQTDKSKIVYSNILNLYTRINFRYKVRKILNDLEKRVDLNNISLIHAHTWYSDGAIALELYKKYNIPYIVTIRNTDLNLFFKYFFHLRKYGLKILRKASKIVFISPVYKERLFEYSFIKPRKALMEKSIILLNGVDEFWLSNAILKKQAVHPPVKLLFIGKFTKGKNLWRILAALELLRNTIKDAELLIVGGGGSEEKRIVAEIAGKNYIKYFGKIHDKNELKNIYRTADIFIMPSKAETFGLVYIEALSQGLPIIFTKNEGIDNLYKNVGEPVHYKSVPEIARAMEQIISNYDSYRFETSEILRNHSWKKIAESYFEIYNNNEKK